MSQELKLITNPQKEGEVLVRMVLAEEKLKHLSNITTSLLQGAMDTWGELWAEFGEHITPGGVVAPEMEKGFVPDCGWPEFLERIWLLKHYLDQAQKYVDEIQKNRGRETEDRNRKGA